MRRNFAIPRIQDKAVLDISLEPQASPEELKKMLANVISAFENMPKTGQDTLKLKISIGHYASIPPPPPDFNN